MCIRDRSEIRDKEIFNKDFLPKVHSKENVIVPVDFVVHKINSHYAQDLDEFEGFKKIFTKEEFLDEIKEIVNESIELFKKSSEFSKSTIDRINRLMKKI